MGLSGSDSDDGGRKPGYAPKWGDLRGKSRSEPKVNANGCKATTRVGSSTLRYQVAGRRRALGAHAVAPQPHRAGARRLTRPSAGARPLRATLAPSRPSPADCVLWTLGGAQVRPRTARWLAGGARAAWTNNLDAGKARALLGAGTRPANATVSDTVASLMELGLLTGTGDDGGAARL